jgi:hypothetical protein
MSASGRSRRALLLTVLSGTILSGCAGFTRFENAVADTAARVEGPLVQMRELERVSLPELTFAPEGLRFFELGRRLERGIGGVPKHLGCALASYDRSASAHVQVDNGATPGVTNYLGLPHARIAARRLRASEPDVQTSSPEECERITADALRRLAS